MSDIHKNNLDTINKKLKEICELMDKEVGIISIDVKYLLVLVQLLLKKNLI